MTRGGKRPGAGRPKGSISTHKVAVAEIARAHTHTAIKTLVAIATKGESDAARVSAAIAILDRGYGKPFQAPVYDPAPVLPQQTDADKAAPAPSGNVFSLEEVRRVFGRKDTT